MPSGFSGVTPVLPRGGDRVWTTSIEVGARVFVVGQRDAVRRGARRVCADGPVTITVDGGGRAARTIRAATPGDAWVAVRDDF